MRLPEPPSSPSTHRPGTGSDSRNLRKADLAGMGEPAGATFGTFLSEPSSRGAVAPILV